jgi:hypothetical protein
MLAQENGKIQLAITKAKCRVYRHTADVAGGDARARGKQTSRQARRDALQKMTLSSACQQEPGQSGASVLSKAMGGRTWVTGDDEAVSGHGSQEGGHLSIVELKKSSQRNACHPTDAPIHARQRGEVAIVVNVAKQDGDHVVGYDIEVPIATAATRPMRSPPLCRGPFGSGIESKA